MIVVMGIISGSAQFSYAQEDSGFFVATNHGFYEKGDVVVISGNAHPVMQDVPVIVQIIADGILVDVAQITIAQDGSFCTPLLQMVRSGKNLEIILSRHHMEFSQLNPVLNLSHLRKQAQ